MSVYTVRAIYELPRIQATAIYLYFILFYNPAMALGHIYNFQTTPFRPVLSSAMLVKSNQE